MTDDDQEEKELLESYERGEWESIHPSKADLRRYQESAKITFAKDKRINIRLSSKDLRDIQKRALKEGVPYQTLIASVLHKYVSGRLKEKPLS